MRDPTAQPSESALYVQVVSTIMDVPQPDWNVLAGEELCYTHLWQRFMQYHLIGHHPWYILVYRHSQLLAAAIHMIPPPPYFFMKNLPRYIQPFFEALAGKLSAFCALPLNFRLNGVLVRPDVTETSGIMSALLSASDRLARRSKRLVQIYLSAEGQTSPLHQALIRRDYVSIPASSYAMLKLGPWQNFDDYLQYLSGKHRREVRRQRRRAAEKQVFVRCLRPREVTVPDRELYHMFCNVMSHHGALQPWLDEGFLATLRTHLNENALFFLAFVKERPVGFILGVHDRHTIDFQIIGLDYEIAREHGVYFLLQYEAVRQAILRGLGAVYMGTTTLDVKRRLGHQIHRRYYFLRSPIGWLDVCLQSALRHSQAAARRWLGEDL